MERLTYRSPEFRSPVSYGACKDVVCDCVCDRCKIQEIVSKLCAYEDTGLTPEEMGRIKEYMQPFTIQDMDRFREIMRAEDSGRLVVLPCKVGATVYANFSISGDYLREKDRPYPCEVVFIGLSGEPFMHIQFPNGRVFPVKFDKIGKTVFLTREAAEAALKEQEE